VQNEDTGCEHAVILANLWTQNILQKLSVTVNPGGTLSVAITPFLS
jgi:hypothetical protein